MDEDYASAALRHFMDAEILMEHRRWGGAGHLFGFAAECAIKHRIETLRPEQDTPHGHFPQILEAARRHLASRRDIAMHAVLRLPNLMDRWTVSLRYSHDNRVSKLDCDLWRDHASRLIGAAGLRRPNWGH